MFERNLDRAASPNNSDIKTVRRKLESVVSSAALSPELEFPQFCFGQNTHINIDLVTLHLEGRKNKEEGNSLASVFICLISYFYFLNIVL